MKCCGVVHDQPQHGENYNCNDGKSHFYVSFCEDRHKEDILGLEAEKNI